MYRYITALVSFLAATAGFYDGPQEFVVAPTNNCIDFTVGSGTGCAWMCNYCATQLGPNYYFTDNVCTYQPGGCVGSPIAGKIYTCCSL